MSKRLHLDIDNSSIIDEAITHEPHAPPDVVFRNRYLLDLIETANELGVDGYRLGELLGAEDLDNPAPDYGYYIDSRRDQRELYQLLDSLMKAICKEIDTERDLVDIRFGDGPEAAEILTEPEQELFETFNLARKYRNQTAFALEQDLDQLIA